MGKKQFAERKICIVAADYAVIAIGAVLMGVALSVFMVPEG